MESGADGYLHKKFKKQLSIDTKFLKNEKENKDNACPETSEEKIKTKFLTNEEQNCHCLAVDDNNRKPDNNESVPNQSTNQHNSSSSFILKSNFPVSSISVEKCAATQSSNSCISYVVSNHLNDDRTEASFDIKYSDQSTNLFNTSSISNTDIYIAKSPYVTEELPIYDYSSRTEEIIDIKNEEPPPPPDKNPNGKYVCQYCSLVCSKPSVLQKHIRAHTNERPFPCKSCGFSFKTRSNLYKHCRSRTHANRVMGNKVQESNEVADTRNYEIPQGYIENRDEQTTSQKPYKPRFHTGKQFFDHVAKENIEKTHNAKHPTSEILSHHINELINKNHSIVHSDDALGKKQISVERSSNNDVRIIYRVDPVVTPNVPEQRYVDEPLNLTNKNRKRTMSEISEPVIHKSLIKELLLKNLSSSDLQCPYCKMIFQTVTELDVHKYRSCKGKPSDIKYTRSSSVNVASILTQNKNAFDNIPYLQNTVFPLNSPGPFLGKTRLIDSDKTKSFSFDSVSLPPLVSPSDPSSNYLLSSLSFDKEKKQPIKLFGGEVKVHTSGETYKMDSNCEKFESDSNYIEYGGKLSENRVIKSSLQSGGTVLTNKTSYNKSELKTPQEIIRVYENNPNSPNIDMSGFSKQKFTFDGITNNMRTSETNDVAKSRLGSESPIARYTNMLDFSQNAVKLITPNIKQPNFSVSNLVLPSKTISNISIDTSDVKLSPKPKLETEILKHSEVDIRTRPPNQINFVIDRKTPNNMYNPMSLVVDGRIIRHVPGMPGPVVAAEPDMAYSNNVTVKTQPPQELPPKIPPLPEQPVVLKLPPEPLTVERFTNSNTETKPGEGLLKTTEMKPTVKITESKIIDGETRKFARPNSLALKPTTAALKQHHGLTPTMFNQILISPDTPRVAKKYAHHFLHGNYFSYLGLKSSTKPVYCTLNKTQPFYVPHFKKLSMYSEWRQQDTKQDRLYASNYDTRQRNNGYSIAGKATANLIIHSSYKFMVSEIVSTKFEPEDDQPKTNALLGGYECNDDYPYIRGRGRGRYVCDQCGIRCKKPSMLKKHIRTHSNDRPYTCSHCNFSFKTKGNLTKHMKSKAHTKNYTASGGSSSSTQHSAQSSESDTDDSGMDSSDESTRQQEHEAAYGLLSLSQKPTPSSIMHSDSDLPHLRSGSPSDFPISSEEVQQVSKKNYARNKFLNDRNSLNINSKKLNEAAKVAATEESAEAQNIRTYLGKCTSRPLTYPYTSILPQGNEVVSVPKPTEISNRVSNPISVDINEDKSVEPRSVIQQFHVIQKYTSQNQLLPPKPVEKSLSPRKTIENNIRSDSVVLNNKRNISPNPTLKLNDVVMGNENISDVRKRKFPTVIENVHQNKIQRNDEVMDLSIATTQERPVYTLEERVFNNTKPGDAPKNVANEIYNTLHKMVPSPQKYDVNEDREEEYSSKTNDSTTNNGTVIILRSFQNEEPINNNYTIDKVDQMNNVNNQMKLKEYDNSAMETLADVATKQVKLEKNTLAKCVASEFLKLATKNENIERDVGNYGPVNKDVNDLIVKSEGNKSCTICSKSFNKPSQLRLHMNIHYLERPFRCDSCSVSFRTKGHLQKHERSASHHNKLSSSPALSSSEPRPFKCSDCNIAFRIHGHLAKHLRSKMHIMKLECLSKIPFGLYAELERSNSLLTEINTTDGDQCLESLKTLAKKVFINNPSKLTQLSVSNDVTSADC